MQTQMACARAAALAGAATLKAREGVTGDVRVKGAATDVVTDADIETGTSVAQAIAEQFPSARFVIEEVEVYDRASVTRGELTDSEVWVIDPLDGTTSFVHGFPCYSISIALLHDGQPVVGVVHNIPAEETFSAALDSGAYLNDRLISCSSRATVEEALLVTGFPYDRTVTLDRQLDVLGRFLRVPVHGIRRDGSAAIDCCHVAAGRADGFWEFGLQTWDVAAGVLINREAGAHVTDISGEAWSTEATGVVCANPTLHSAMLDVIHER